MPVFMGHFPKIQSLTPKATFTPKLCVLPTPDFCPQLGVQAPFSPPEGAAQHQMTNICSIAYIPSTQVAFLLLRRGEGPCKAAGSLGVRYSTTPNFFCAFTTNHVLS